MSVLLAGVFRSRTDTETESVAAHPCACGLGTDAAD
jgi:hypothetical protein